jgi:hypothetical protein
VWTTSGFLNQQDDAEAVAVDSHDKIYVGGATGPLPGSGSSGGSTGLVAKYDSAAARNWLTLAYSSPQLDIPSGMAIDSSNNIFLAGETYRYQGADAFIVKYDQNGSRLWEQHIGSPDNEFGKDVAVDSAGNAYLSGSTTGNLGVGRTGNPYDGFLVKYSPNGTKQWTMQFPDSIGDTAETVSVNSAGSIYVAGAIGLLDSYVAKFDSDRNLAWRITPNYSVNGGYTQIEESATDGNGNLYVVGATNAVFDGLGFSQTDTVVAKYDTLGNLLWQRQLALRKFDNFDSVTVDSSGNVYVAGSTFDNLAGINGGVADSLWAKYDSAGNLLSLNQFGTAEVDGANGIAVDHFGRVYVAGYVARDANGYSQGDTDAYLTRFDPVPEPAATWLAAIGGAFVLMWRTVNSGISSSPAVRCANTICTRRDPEC